MSFGAEPITAEARFLSGAADKLAAAVAFALATVPATLLGFAHIPVAAGADAAAAARAGTGDETTVCRLISFALLSDAGPETAAVLLPAGSLADAAAVPPVPTAVYLALLWSYEYHC